MGKLKACEAEVQATLPKAGPMAKLIFKMNETDVYEATQASYLAAALAGIGWEVPSGWTPLKALANPRV
jgi:hypothetical protein